MGLTDEGFSLSGAHLIRFLSTAPLRCPYPCSNPWVRISMVDGSILEAHFRGIMALEMDIWFLHAKKHRHQWIGRRGEPRKFKSPSTVTRSLPRPSRGHVEFFGPQANAQDATEEFGRHFRSRPPNAIWSKSSSKRTTSVPWSSCGFM